MYSVIQSLFDFTLKVQKTALGPLGGIDSTFWH